MKKYIYLGGFPPPYGGVTIKNKLLFDKINKVLPIEQSEFFNKDKNFILRIFSLIKDLVVNRENAIIIGLSQGSLRKVTYLLNTFNPKLMEYSIVIVMGGTFPKMVSEDIKLQIYLTKYKKIYVETNAMRNRLNQNGINNVSVFPNCRERLGIELPNRTLNNESNNKIKCLFFSLISKEKGADVVISASSILSKTNINYQIDFFGHIDKKYADEFRKAIDNDTRIKYCGVFKANDTNDVYKIMSQYDVLLFPTKWKNEGVPGVLVESKIAGITAIVSDINYNCEIVESKKTGIILKQNTPNELANVIEKLYSNRAWLMDMKKNAMDSAEHYLIENYIEDIVQMIRK